MKQNDNALPVLTGVEKQKAMERFATLVERLASVGLATETRVGKDHSLLVFVRVISEEHMYGEVYRSRCVAAGMNTVRLS